VNLTLLKTNDDPEVLYSGILTPIYKEKMGDDSKSEKYITEKFTGEGTLNLNVDVFSSEKQIIVTEDTAGFGAGPGNKAIVYTKKGEDDGVDFFLGKFNQGQTLTQKIQEMNLL
jgi:hypothetical protein